MVVNHFHYQVAAVICPDDLHCQEAVAKFLEKGRGFEHLQGVVADRCVDFRQDHSAVVLNGVHRAGVQVIPVIDKVLRRGAFLLEIIPESVYVFQVGQYLRTDQPQGGTDFLTVMGTVNPLLESERYEDTQDDCQGIQYEAF